VWEVRHLPASDWTFQKLKTIGEAYRAIVNESFCATLNSTLRNAQQPHFSKNNLFKKLGLA
jgi:hypothetical protein